MKLETVIGLEIHAQLLTKSKMFCSCPNQFGDQPNSNICPVCTGQPGSLPVTNKKAIELAIKTSLALHCQIEPYSIFARKNYFYPDLPKGYQISQYELPLATKGYLEIVVNGQTRKIGITRVHLEEDAGKLVHKGAERIMGAEESLVDFNRTGTPLMEIVSEPDLRTPEESAIYVQTLAELLHYIGVCDAKMEEGSLRCDANISVREFGVKEFGVKTEVKNMNSFKAIEKALRAEEQRHKDVVSEGGKIIQETRFFDETTELTSGMRVKEFAHDYRYFPDPDLVPIEPSAEWIANIKSSLGELPQERKARLIDTLKLSPEIAQIVVADRPLADYLETTVKLYPKASVVANWLVGDIMAWLKDKKKVLTDLVFPPKELAELLKMIDDGTISGKLAKNILAEALTSGKPVKEIVAHSGQTQISDSGELEKVINEIINNNPQQVAEFKNGKESVLTFFVGQVMKATKGRANPALTISLLKKLL